MEYIILEDWNAEGPPRKELENRVCCYIRQGYKPIGGVTFVKDTLWYGYQAMIKE